MFSASLLSAYLSQPLYLLFSENPIYLQWISFGFSVVCACVVLFGVLSKKLPKVFILFYYFPFLINLLFIINYKKG